jgi:hypothetical protein
VRKLAAQESPSDEGTTGTALEAGVACECLCRALTRSLGAIGSRLLLERALSQAQAEHAVLREVTISARGELALTGIELAASAHGEPLVIAGLETVLSALLALLGRLIGRDMVARLVAQSVPMVVLEEDKK